MEAQHHQEMELTRQHVKSMLTINKEYVVGMLKFMT